MRRFSVSITLSILIVLTVLTSLAAQAQTYKVIYNFTGGQDGGNPFAGLTMDRSGKLYGTTRGAGGAQYGTVFKLTPKGSSWVFTPLYAFTAGNDGAYPYAGVTIGPDGSLYGTTDGGGGGGCGGAGCGTVFNLKPSASACRTALCGWTETVLYRFAGGTDGGNPHASVIFDPAGNLYGTTIYGGNIELCRGCGTVFELTHSGGGWMESVIYAFTGHSDGAYPESSVTFDGVGNLYGTTPGNGGGFYGTVFQLTPSGPPWIENTLYTFQYSSSAGAYPIGGLIFDTSGNLYGTTSAGGSGGGGTVYQLTPSSPPNWTLVLLYSLTGGVGDGPQDSLTMDADGNLYGTTMLDGAYRNGSVFKLTPSGGSWTYTDLYDFCSGGSPCRDGEQAGYRAVLDANGNLYGTTVAGGAYGYGVVFEITP